LQREVLTVDTASPGVIPNSTTIVVICPTIRAEKAKAEFVTAKLTYRQWWWWCNHFFRAGDRLPCGC
jgi:hypothetical protein